MTTLLLESEFTRLASEDQISKTARALEANGIRTIVAETGEEARTRVLNMLPPEAEHRRGYYYERIAFAGVFTDPGTASTT